MPSPILVTNRRARRDYLVEETLEAGIALKGAEVKSLRAGRGNLAGSYAALQGEEVWLHNFHISPYACSGSYSPPPRRPRKLLLHRREIKKLIGWTTRKGYTLIPLKAYLRRGLVKIELAVARGKKTYDKRQAIKKRESDLEMARAARLGKRRVG